MFRYPYLDEGSPPQYQAARAELKKMGYTLADVTVKNCDYYMAYLLQSALRGGQKVDFSRLKKVYLGSMLEYVDFFEEWYETHGHAAINHVLLMHSNDLTALYIGDLMQALRDKGWEIISVHDAYKPVPMVVMHPLENMGTKVENKAAADNPATKRNAPKSMSTRYLSDLFHQEKVFIDEKSQETYTASN